MREANDDAHSYHSRRSQISKAASKVARSGAAQSLVGSAAMLRERLQKDFGIGEHNNADDTKSDISGLEDEIDEWAALNKYNVLRSF